MPAISQDATTPSPAPRRPTPTPSVRNMATSVERRAPMARSAPISTVRSNTAIVMVLATENITTTPTMPANTVKMPV